MKSGLGLKSKYRSLLSYVNLFRFTWRKYLAGFEQANLFLQKVDKLSLLIILKKNGAKIGENCDIESGQIFHNCRNYSNLFIGDNCHVGKNCFFDLRDRIVIKDSVVISMKCTFITHIDLSKSKLSKIFREEQKPILICNDVYIGVSSIILMGVKLNKECAIASGSLVNNDVETGRLVGGVPAKFIKIIHGD